MMAGTAMAAAISKQQLLWAGHASPLVADHGTHSIVHSVSCNLNPAHAGPGCSPVDLVGRLSEEAVPRQKQSGLGLVACQLTRVGAVLRPMAPFQKAGLQLGLSVHGQDPHGQEQRLHCMGNDVHGGHAHITKAAECSMSGKGCKYHAYMSPRSGHDLTGCAFISATLQ